MNDNEPLVSVIIPAYNARDYLASALPAVKSSYYTNLELIVVDDSSTDGSGDFAKKYTENVIRTEEKVAPGKARNIGARFSKGSILLFVDADVKVYPETVSLVVSAMEKDPEITAIFGSYDENPSAENFFSQYKNLFHHFVHQSAKDKASTFWAGCGAIRRDSFFEAGGFPEGYSSPAIEDVELGYKLTDNGEKIILLKELQVKHLKEWNFRSLMKADIVNRAVPWTKLAFKKGLPRDLNFKIYDRISAVIGSLLFINFFFMWRWPFLVLISIVFAAILFCLNRDLYVFFLRKKGPAFTVAAVFFHWFYFFYSAATFALVTSFLYAKGLFAEKRCQSG